MGAGDALLSWREVLGENLDFLIEELKKIIQRPECDHRGFRNGRAQPTRSLESW